MKTALWLLPFLALNVLAQEYRGTVTGLVTDPSSALVASAGITLTNNATGLAYQYKTSDSGIYIFNLVPAGEYTLKVTAAGFTGFSRSPIIVQVQSRVEVNVSLELGPVSETVSVRSESPLLETASASTGQVIENRRIVELPLNGRNPLALAQISPGVISIDGPSFLRAFDVNGASSISIGGGLTATGGAVTRSNDFTLDGAPNTTRGNTVAYVPPADAVQECQHGDDDEPQRDVLGDRERDVVRQCQADHHGDDEHDDAHGVRHDAGTTGTERPQIRHARMSVTRMPRAPIS